MFFECCVPGEINSWNICRLDHKCPGTDSAVSSSLSLQSPLLIHSHYACVCLETKPKEVNNKYFKNG